MTDIKKFKRGHRTYTRMGQFREVRIDSNAKKDTPLPTSPSQQIQMDIDPRTEVGFYSNTTIVHRSSEEVVLDFSFVPAHASRARILSRVILSHKQAKQVAALLAEAANEKP